MVREDRSSPKEIRVEHAASIVISFGGSLLDRAAEG